MILTKEYVSEFLEYNPETGKIYWKKDKSPTARKGNEAGYVFRNTKTLHYIYIEINYKSYRAHRLAFFVMTGRWPQSIDHINGDGTDNRWCNLREVSQKENAKNQKLRNDNLSGVTGVRFNKKKGKWVSYITVNYKQHYLGAYENYKDAVDSRKKAEVKYGFHKNHGTKR